MRSAVFLVCSVRTRSSAESFAFTFSSSLCHHETGAVIIPLDCREHRGTERLRNNLRSHFQQKVPPGAG